MVLGDLHVTPISDGTARLPPEYFVNSDWGPHQGLLDPNGLVQIALGCFLVRTSQHTVLVDAGMGPMSNQFFEGGELPAALDNAGAGPADIDLVICTHLHIDHTGWLVQDDKPFFPNATVRFGAPDWTAFVDTALPPMPMTRDAFLILESAGRIDPIEGEGEVVPGVSALMAPGHTPGHMCLVLSSGARRALLLGDAVTCPIQLEEPEWQAMSDIDPAMAQRTREALWRELENTEDVAVASHFPGLTFHRVLAGQGKRYWV
jgi:glyoxylase-like metal-dependent hydrolase (beta-lactamase superfamily II)